MKVSEEIFRTYKPDFQKLLSFGFTEEKGCYKLSRVFFGGTFTAEVTVFYSGETAVKVIENEFGDEYVQVNNENFDGAFVGEVRTALKEILTDIRDNAFNKQSFVSDQANRLEKIINEKYNEFADYPFRDVKFRDYGVFRRKDNGKWYALVMNVERKVLGKDYKNEPGRLDIINLKVDEKQRDELVKKNGIIPSYHMNKQKWISVFLDESLSDEFIINLLDTSRELVKSKTKRSKK